MKRFPWMEILGAILIVLVLGFASLETCDPNAPFFLQGTAADCNAQLLGLADQPLQAHSERP